VPEESRCSSVSLSKWAIKQSWHNLLMTGEEGATARWTGSHWVSADGAWWWSGDQWQPGEPPDLSRESKSPLGARVARVVLRVQGAALASAGVLALAFTAIGVTQAVTDSTQVSQGLTIAFASLGVAVFLASNAALFWWISVRLGRAIDRWRLLTLAIEGILAVVGVLISPIGDLRSGLLGLLGLVFLAGAVLIVASLLWDGARLLLFQRSLRNASAETAAAPQPADDR
jgi:hypothetical protein